MAKQNDIPENEENSATGYEGLPVEILNHVLSFLSFKEKLIVRLVNRTSNQVVEQNLGDDISDEGRENLSLLLSAPNDANYAPKYNFFTDRGQFSWQKNIPAILRLQLILKEYEQHKRLKPEDVRFVAIALRIKETMPYACAIVRSAIKANASQDSLLLLTKLIGNAKDKGKITPQWMKASAAIEPPSPEALENMLLLAKNQLTSTNWYECRKGLKTYCFCIPHLSIERLNHWLPIIFASIDQIPPREFEHLGVHSEVISLYEILLKQVSPEQCNERTKALPSRIIALLNVDDLNLANQALELYEKWLARLSPTQIEAEMGIISDELKHNDLLKRQVSIAVYGPLIAQLSTEQFNARLREIHTNITERLNNANGLEREAAVITYGRLINRLSSEQFNNMMSDIHANIVDTLSDPQVASEALQVYQQWITRLSPKQFDQYVSDIHTNITPRITDVYGHIREEALRVYEQWMMRLSPEQFNEWVSEIDLNITLRLTDPVDFVQKNATRTYVKWLERLSLSAFQQRISDIHKIITAYIPNTNHRSVLWSAEGAAYKVYIQKLGQLSSVQSDDKLSDIHAHITTKLSLSHEDCFAREATLQVYGVWIASLSPQYFDRNFHIILTNITPRLNDNVEYVRKAAIKLLRDICSRLIHPVQKRVMINIILRSIIQQRFKEELLLLDILSIHWQTMHRYITEEDIKNLFYDGYPRELEKLNSQFEQALKKRKHPESNLDDHEKGDDACHISALKRARM